MLSVSPLVAVSIQLESLFVLGWGGFLGGSLLFLLITVIVILGLNEVPLLLALDGGLQRSVGVAAAVVSDGDFPPELVGEEGNTNDVRIVDFVIMADPAADHAPEGLDSGVSSETRDFSWLAA